MKKFLVGILLSLVTVIAFALPSPRQIEDALAANRYSDAQSMVSQVLRERPDSARAHLLNAYLLIHVNHDKTAANAELNTAAGLDRNGDVKNSPLFGRVVGEIDTYQGATRSAPRQVVQSGPMVQQAAVSPVAQSEPEKKGESHLLLWLFVFFGVVAVLAYLLIRGANRREREEASAYTPYTTRGSRQLTQTRSGGTYTAPYNPPPVPLDPYTPAVVFHQPAPVQVVQQAPQQSFGSQVAATASGVVVGELIHDALTSSKHHSRTWEEPVREREVVRERDPDWGSPARSSYTRDESPVSYSNERSSFSSSSRDDDSWSSGSSSSSSSSSDSSWSSGSDSSSSSWDSGSSSSSSDW
jgi:uncharacterized membrane protein YgcG